MLNTFTAVGSFGRWATMVTGNFVMRLGTRLPLNGTGGSAIHPPGGWSNLFSGNADDDFLSIAIPAFTLNSIDYSTVYLGSNTFFTFTAGSTAYNSLSATNPALPKIFLGSADNSYQRVSSLTSGFYTRIRYEGTASTGGTGGSPNIVFEATFFDKTMTGGQPTVEVLFGQHARTGGQAGIATASAYLTTFTPAANQSYVFVGNSTGSTWTIYPGYFMSGTGY